MKVKIRFAADNSLTSWLIRIFTWSRVSHCDYVIERPEGLEYFGALPSTGVDFNKLDFKRTEFYEIDVPNPKAFEDFLFSQRGKAYDWMAIISLVARRPWQRDKKWFCSELLAAALEKGGTKLFNEKHARITPRDLYINAKFRRIE